MTDETRSPDEQGALDADAAAKAKAAAERAAARKRAARAKAKEAAAAGPDDEVAEELKTIDRKEVLEGVRAWVEESREELRERVEAAAKATGAEKREAEKLARRCKAGFLEVRLMAWGVRFSLARWGATLGGFFPLFVLGLGGLLWALQEWRLRSAVAAAEKRWEKQAGAGSSSSSGPAGPASPTPSAT